MCWLDLHGRVSRWSDASARLFGRSADEAVGIRFHELFAPEDRDAGRPEIGLARAREGGSWDDVGWRPSEVGEKRQRTAYSVTFVRTPNGVDIGYMVVGRDLGVLEHHDRETGVSPSAARLLSAGRVAMEVAHEVGNVLAAARGFTSALERHLPSDGLAHQVWRELLKACDRGSAITRRMLRVGRPPEEESGQVDLGPLVRGLEPLLRQILPDRILLVTSVDDRLPRIQGRQSDLELVLLNLVVNARDAIDGGGTIAISATAMSGERESADERVVLTVRDSGSGIPADLVDRVFDRFFTTKDAKGGTGLGLTLVRDAVLACRGTVEIDSGRGAGTTIRVGLRTAGAAASANPVRRGAPSPGVRERVVLVCARDGDLLRLVAGLLQRNGFGVLEATTAREAGALLRAHSGTVDVALVGTGPWEDERTELLTELASDGAGAPALFLLDGPADAAARARGALVGDGARPGSVASERLVDEIEQLLVDAGVRRQRAVH